MARAASTILQRAIQTNIDQTGWHEVTDQCVQDYLVVGRGTPWARYEPHFENVSAGPGEAGRGVGGWRGAGCGIWVVDPGGEGMPPAVPQAMPTEDEDGTEGRKMTAANHQ